MAKRAKGSPRTGRALRVGTWDNKSPSNPSGDLTVERPYPYGRRSPWGGYGRGRVRGESGDTGDEGGGGYEDTAAPVENFKQGGSVKVRGSGIATQGVRPAKMVKMKGS